ncbi:hypothetical protein DICSQDRAFT_152180 [Dichomitus squalens LYAD-421 SS1]|uniref:uncharacterized protein n=1 Tax=Dichomitus squalens (strain LYAD-421) TaxID=732165 RepID=UPI00044119E4|nr:uncharacterized protein DICSQDRAFT_152180 [Dichomitus squalens LYAD-421 SS1]EJF66197.1 hypothetical protein DICSQDRAFT_152180 [Dichomitus squalens LYAD-421 SS1]
MVLHTLPSPVCIVTRRSRFLGKCTTTLLLGPFSYNPNPSHNVVWKHVSASTNNSHVPLRSRLAALPPHRAARTKRIPRQVSWTVPPDFFRPLPLALFPTGRPPQKAALPWSKMDAVGTTFSSSQAPTGKAHSAHPGTS